MLALNTALVGVIAAIATAEDKTSTPKGRQEQ